MWIVNWFQTTLQSLGFFNKKAKIVFFGLDDAGKTTLLLKLKENVMKQVDPTLQPHSEQVKIGKVNFKAWDLGGHEAARKTWKNYISDIDGIIYLIDASNKQRFEESRIQLHGVLQMVELQKIPVVVLGNKIDKSGAVSYSELRSSLSLDDYCNKTGSQGKNERQIQMFMCSVAKSVGYQEGFQWLSKHIK